MSKKYFLKKVSDYAIVGGLGASLIFGLTACEDKNANGSNSSSGGVTQAAQKKGAFVIIEKTPTESYKIVDEFPSTSTTIVLIKKEKEKE